MGVWSWDYGDCYHNSTHWQQVTGILFRDAVRGTFFTVMRFQRLCSHCLQLRRHIHLLRCFGLDDRRGHYYMVRSVGLRLALSPVCMWEGDLGFCWSISYWRIINVSLLRDSWFAEGQVLSRWKLLEVSWSQRHWNNVHDQGSFAQAIKDTEKHPTLL